MSSKRLLFIISIVTFSVMFCISVVGPLLNELAIEEGIPLGKNPNLTLGIIFSLGTIALALFQIPAALLANKLGRRIVVLSGSIFLGISTLLIGYSGVIGIYLPKFNGLDPKLIILAISRFIQGGFAAATWPILMALIAVYYREGDIGFAMGIFGASFGLGMALGPVIGPIIVATIDIYTPFIVAAVLAFIAGLVSFKIPSEGGVKIERRLIIDRRLIAVSLVAFTLLYTLGSIVVIYPRYIRSFLGLDVKVVAMAMAAASILYTFLQPLGGRLADRVDKRVLILSFSIPFTIVSSLFGYARDTFSILLLMSLFGILGGFIFPASNALVGSIAPEGLENIYSGFYNMMLSLGITVSPILIGLLSDLIGYSYAYISNGILMIATILIFIINWNELK